VSVRSTPTCPFAAVFFDFDGTLADSYTAITASVNHVRGKRGLAPLTEPEVRRHVGHGPGHLLSATVGIGDPAENAAWYREHHPTVMESHTHLLPGVAAALPALHGAGLRLAVCSNKPRDYTRRLLEVLEIASYFETVLGPEDVPNAKPAPDMLLAGLERLGLDKDAALYVGDMTVDIATARAAGVTVWIVPTGSDPRNAIVAARPDKLFESISELPVLLGIVEGG
jgi:phosphoglycolate phosphatase